VAGAATLGLVKTPTLSRQQRRWTSREAADSALSYLSHPTAQRANTLAVGARKRDVARMIDPHDCSRAEPAAFVDAREMLAKDDWQASRATPPALPQLAHSSSPPEAAGRL
jgi:hypothetical protein